MKQYTKKQPRKSFVTKRKLLVLGLVLVVGVGAALWAWHRHDRAIAVNKTASQKHVGETESNVNYGPPTPSEKSAAEQQKKQIIQDETNGGSQPANQTIGVTIVRANQLGAGQPLQVRTLVTGTTSGTCTITLTKSGQATVTKTANISFEATTASCGAVNIDASEFAAAGDWALSVTAKNGTATSPVATQTVTVAK